MRLIGRVATGIGWRYRLWAWGDRLRVGNKFVNRDPAMTTPIVLKLMALGRYEEPERRLLAYMQSRGHMGKGDRVLEAGGGLGTVTMHIAEIVGDDAIVVFEPNPRTAKALCANLALNGHHVDVEVAALTAVPSNDIPFADAIDIGGFAVSGTHCRSREARIICVRAETLADAIARIDPTVLVLDVEGAEYDLLMSVTAWARVHSIHLEIHPNALSPNQIAEMFERAGAFGFHRIDTPDFGANIVLLARSRPAAAAKHSVCEAIR
jgi:FkbM family methyltransferase